ncbi:hypothetical protein VNO77_43436 [Canavalia gladiata]|uniref:Uncharacterized protein n=1 Tax=Canavalia gladiata TaxID=3824 RepID=A0AAN9JU78_CANGL
MPEETFLIWNLGWPRSSQNILNHDVPTAYSPAITYYFSTSGLLLWIRQDENPTPPDHEDISDSQSLYELTLATDEHDDNRANIYCFSMVSQNFIYFTDSTWMDGASSIVA